MSNQEIKNLIQQLLIKMGIDVTDVTEELLENPTHTILFTIQTPEPQKLIGREGVGFQALNRLVVQMVAKESQDMQKFTVDVDGYYKQSLENIKQKALFAAERARSLETSIELEPMNAFERLLVHSLFPEGGDIKTHSEGVGDGRHVVLRSSGDI